MSEEHIDQCILHLGVLALLFLRTSSYHDQAPGLDNWTWSPFMWPFVSGSRQIVIGLLPGKALCWGSCWHLWLARINLGTTVLSIETFKKYNDIQKHPHSSFLCQACVCCLGLTTIYLTTKRWLVERHTCGVWRILVTQLWRGIVEEEGAPYRKGFGLWRLEGSMVTWEWLSRKNNYWVQTANSPTNVQTLLGSSLKTFLRGALEAEERSMMTG